MPEPQTPDRAAPGATVLVVEHQATCPPALLGEWLDELGCDVTVWHAGAGEPLPAPLAAYDALLVLGGEMGAGDDDAHPWLRHVKELLREAVTQRRPTLGVCLGHQLVAVALGGRVEPNPAGQTVGLRQVGWRDDAAADPLFGALVPAAPDGDGPRGIHWNSDVVTALPDGAVALATTEDGAPQVVRYGEACWGVQLHPEADLEVVRSWAEGDRADHLERGLDTDAELRAIDAARDELRAVWRPLAVAFAGLAHARAQAHAQTHAQTRGASSA